MLQKKEMRHASTSKLRKQRASLIFDWAVFSTAFLSQVTEAERPY